MKKRICSIMLYLFLFTLTLSLCSCYPAKKVSEEYLDLKNAAFPDDRFSAVTRLSGQSPNADPAVCHVKCSSSYMGFQAYFYKDGTVSDAYYCEYLHDDAENYIRDLFSSSDLCKDLRFDLQIRYYDIPEITYKKLESFEELRNLRPDYPFLYLTLKSDETAPAKELIDAVLITLQENSCYGTFVPVDDIEWYDISADAIFKTIRTGMDGGKMLERDEYHPGEE